MIAEASGSGLRTPHGPPRGDAAPRGDCQLVQRYGARMRTHTFSAQVQHVTSGEWSVCIVQKTYKSGVMSDARIVYGPIWVAEDLVQHHVLQALKRLQQLVRDDEERQSSA